MKVLGKRVLVAPKKAEEVTATGLVMVGGVRDGAARGTVVAVGSEVPAGELREGDVVLYNPHTARPAGDQVVVDLDDVFAVVTP